MTACLRLCRVEVPEWPRFFPLQGLMTSRYPGEDAVPFSPKGSGITPDVGQQVVTPQTECSPSPAYRADFGETNRTRRVRPLENGSQLPRQARGLAGRQTTTVWCDMV